MRYTFDYDRAEFVRAHRAVQRNGESPWRHTVKALAGLALISAIVCMVAGYVLRAPRWANVFYVVSIWSLLMALYFWLFSWIAVKWAARQQEKQRPDFAHPLSGALDESGYVCESFSGTTRLKWDGVRRVVETPEFLLLYIMKQYAYYLPKRAIPADDLAAVRRLLREQLGDRAVLMKG